MSESGPEEPFAIDVLLPETEARRASLWLNALVLELGGPGAEVGLAFCSDKAMTETNRRFRDRKESTDVLSFPGSDYSGTSEGFEGGTSSEPVGRAPEGFGETEARVEVQIGERAQAPYGSHQYLGDVLISVDCARRQAEAAGQSLGWELQCLILHGLLHCLGHDHEQDGGAMDAMELDLRKRWVSEAAPWEIPEGAELPLGANTRLDQAVSEDARFGRVALVGRPNAGKSTLMNRWLGEKLAIVSDKPQTTRHRIVGILSEERGQMVFLDTPGIHKPQHRLNRRMVKAASDALSEADVICLLVDASVKSGAGDQFVQELIGQKSQPKMILLNKIDSIKKSRLLPLMERYAEAGFEPVIPISALDGDGAEGALDVVWEMLPRGSAEFDKDLLTLQTERFLTAERIREKILERTRDELPFVVAVVIDQWEERDDGVLYLAASILVERGGQKSILIGKGGQQIKAVGIAAREDLEEFLGKRVFLDLVVRAEKGWREDPRVIAEIENYQMA